MSCFTPVRVFIKCNDTVEISITVLMEIYIRTVEEKREDVDKINLKYSLPTYLVFRGILLRAI